MTKHLSDNQLLKKTLTARTHERKFTIEILEYLEEIDKRKLYVDEKCSSLFNYCVHILAYSKAEAAIRVNATRLIKNEPSAKKQVRTGKLSLTNASEIQSFFQQEKPTPEIKKTVLKNACGKTKRETQKIIQEFSTRPQKFLKITIHEKLLKKIERVQTKLDIDSELQLIEILIDQKIKELELNRKNHKQRGSKNQRYISRISKKEVFEKANYQCENCKSHKNLQIDHIRPISQGGNGKKENLQLLCFACNQRRFIKTHSQLPIYETGQDQLKLNS